MSTTIRPEISKDSPYYISKHRYYELKHFCLQYPEWEEEYRRLCSMSISGKASTDNPNWSDPTGNRASRMADLSYKMELVRDVAMSVDPVIGKFIFLAVTKDKSYTWLRTVAGIPCGKNVYYELYRIFFKLLSRKE